MNALQRRIDRWPVPVGIAIALLLEWAGYGRAAAGLLLLLIGWLAHAVIVLGIRLSDLQRRRSP
jgi:hypothetical protein